MLNFSNAGFGPVSSREWIVTNGIGGYASSSICGANTRRYHGLLVAACNPPTDRRVMVSKIEEKISVEGEEIFLSSNQYPDIIYPDGYKLLTSFERHPFPKSVFSSDIFSISKTIFMIYGTNTTVVEYVNSGSLKIELTLSPLLVYRDYHHLFRESDFFPFSCESLSVSKLKITPKDKESPIYIEHTKGHFRFQDDWYRDFEYYREKERGLDFREDCKSIGDIDVDLAPGETVYITLSTEKSLPDGDPSSWKVHEQLRLDALSQDIDNAFLRDLVVSGDQFLVWRLSSRSHTLIAGYHWFADWGRDTMIAMRGLVIATGKKQIAESIFRTFLKYLDKGMIPNRFPDLGEEPEYNTIDASLWLFVALYEYYKKFNDLDFIKGIFSSLTEIIESHYAGTRYHIQVTKEGLLSGGENHTQLTWMDAKVGDHVVTPRQGCAVEINALWYNALQVYLFFGRKLGMRMEEIATRIDITESSFRKYFISPSGYLNDVVIPGQFTDDAIRPNQVYAISLPYSPLKAEEKKKVLKVIDYHLYTDLGLRSLATSHPDFKPIYTGDQWQRDHAYHQGTVWAYLWGEYAIAYLSLHHYSDASKKFIRKKSEALRHHFYKEDGIHAISEIFDGENPGAGKGCIHQAWSIGMTLKALLAAE